MASSEMILDYRRQEGTPAFDGPVVAIITLGLLSACLGLYALDRTYHFMDADPVTMTLFIYILSGLLLIHAYCAIVDHVITETVMLIIAAFTAMLYSAYILDGYSIVMLSILLFVVGFAICSFFMFIRGEKFMGAVAGVFAIILFVKITLSDVGSVPASILLCINGFTLLFFGGMALAGHPVGNVIRRPRAADISDEDFPKVLEATIGLLVFVALVFSLGLADFDGTASNSVFFLYRLLMSILCMAVGAYGVYHDIVNDGALLFIVGLSALVQSAGMILVGSAPLLFDVVPGILLFILSFVMLKDREYYEGLTSFKYGLLMILEIIVPGSGIVAILITIMKFSITGFAFYSMFTMESKNMSIMEAIKKITGRGE